MALSTLNILSHCLLVSRVSDEKSHNFMEDPSLVYDESLLSAQDISLSLALENLIIVCFGVGLFQFISNLKFIFKSLIKFETFPGTISSNIPSAPLSLSLLLLGFP